MQDDIGDSHGEQGCVEWGCDRAADTHEEEREQQGDRDGQQGGRFGARGRAAERSARKDQGDACEEQDEARFGSYGVAVGEDEEGGEQSQYDGCAGKEQLRKREKCFGCRERTAGEQPAEQQQRCGEIASDAPIDVTEDEERKQYAGKGHRELAERPAEELYGQRQQQQQRQCGGCDERQQPEVERGAEDGVEAESVAERAGVVLGGEGQQSRSRARREESAVTDAAEQDAVERDGEARADRVEVVPRREPSDAESGEEDQQPADPAGAARVVRLEVGEPLAGEADRHAVVRLFGKGFRCCRIFSGCCLLGCRCLRFGSNRCVVCCSRAVCRGGVLPGGMGGGIRDGCWRSRVYSGGGKGLSVVPDRCGVGCGGRLVGIRRLPVLGVVIRSRCMIRNCRKRPGYLRIGRGCEAVAGDTIGLAGGLRLCL